MARVPVVRERSVRQAGIQAQPLSPNIPQGAAGIDLTGAANELSDWALRQQDQANQVATMEADSALQQWENEYLYNPETGAMNRQGRNAFGLPEESSQAFEQQRQAIRQGLANDRQRQGVIPTSLLTGGGVIWLLGTDDVKRNARGFLEVSPGCLAQIMTRYHHLHNYVDQRNTASIRWLKWMGFEFQPAQPFGPYGLPFHRFEKRA